MIRELTIRVSPETAAQTPLLKAAVARELGIDVDRVHAVVPRKRSLDARQRSIKVLLRAEIYLDESLPDLSIPKPDYPDVSRQPEVIVVGAGPAGLFAALRLIELGLKPIVLERGKDVRARRRDLARLNKEHLVNPESNYCFGEGGAGTYSDGKLYTRSTKRGDVKRILHILVQHGAQPDIRVDAHPHIGTNKLPGVVTGLRESIRAAGGEVRFGTKVTGLWWTNGSLAGVRTEGGSNVLGKAVLLATGHSARDVFSMLHQEGVLIEAKPFALGVRAEHPQTLIDRVQYRRAERGEFLPPASYSLVHQAQGRGVYSFCMCPGGIIAPCATAPGEVVTNGWSPSKRNNPFANSGMVVSVEPADWARQHGDGPLAALAYQAAVEKRAWEAGGKTQTAPAQRLTDFLRHRPSGDLPDVSYVPGVASSDLWQVLPRTVADRLAEGFRAFGKKMRGYVSEEAVLVGVESRTSSPVRIPRDRETRMHPGTPGLFPCGEGAGYAGGIVSAAIDGERCAEAIARWVAR